MPAEQGDAERFAAAEERGVDPRSVGDPGLARDLQIAALLRGAGASDALAPREDERARMRARMMAELAGAAGPAGAQPAGTDPVAEPDTAPCRDRFLACGIDQDERHRRRAAVDTHDATATDAFGREVRKDALTDRVVAAAERSGKGGAPAEPRHRQRRVRGAAAAGDDEVGGRHLGAGRREILHAHHDVLHRNAGAQNRPWIPSQSRSRPRPRRG